MAFINACIADSSAPYREVKRVQFGILSPDEIVSLKCVPNLMFGLYFMSQIKFLSEECQSQTMAALNIQKQQKQESQNLVV
jgi:hypothetical protein